MRPEPWIYCPIRKKCVPISQRIEKSLRPRPTQTLNIITDAMDPIGMVGLEPRYPGDGTVRDVVVDSKTQRKRLLKEHNMIELGNEEPEMVTRKREEMREKDARKQETKHQ